MKARFLFPILGLALAFAGAGCNRSSQSSKLNTQSSSPPPAGPVELKLKWTPGEHIVQEYNMDQTMLMNLPGRPEPIKQHMTLGQKFSLTVVNAEPDGSHELEMEFISLHVAMEGGRSNMNYDSADDSITGAADPLGKVFDKLIGCKIQYFLDPSNKVERVGGIDDLINRVSEGGPMTGVLKSMFNEDYFKQMMTFNRFLPPNPVQPGDTWPAKIQFSTRSLGLMDMNYNLTFKGWEMHEKRNCARIEMSGDIETEPGAGPGPTGVTTTIPEGNTSGVFWFDPEFGTAVSSKLNQDMTMLMTVPKMAGDALPQTITNQLSQAIDFKVDSLE